MNDDPLNEIPEEFHSLETGKPFRQCLECECDLKDKEYFIEKAFRTYPGFSACDVIFELAICIDCAEKLRKSMSDSSQKKIAEYLAANANTHEQMYVIHEYPLEPSRWTQNCLVSGDSKESVTEFQIYAHCHGNQLILDLMPYMLSGNVLDEMTQLLSNETLGEMDDFMGRHFGPPKLEKDLPTHRTILV